MRMSMKRYKSLTLQRTNRSAASPPEHVFLTQFSFLFALDGQAIEAKTTCLLLWSKQNPLSTMP
eukprot:m.268740 g.268740  ORF g.268740 m.268740 type:complete len:64 (-) comp38520_c0_seq1:70-261(-)